MKDLPRVSVKELAHKIKGYGTPRFAFFLGAGASRQSDIITAGEMIRYFKERIIAQCCPDSAKTDEERGAWLSEQEWYKENGSEYCKLFKKLEPKEIGRQRYIESIIEKREPSFGYVVLANLIASNYINTIITTNFDDLVYSACTTFTSIRPIVYAYGVMASEMRITAQRPKILKLHGDFLYSTLKNTDNEIAAQDPNMARQLRQVLSEYGLIVLGYSGGDNSIMDNLAQISERNDLYWCVRRGDEPNEAVKKLLEDKGGFLVEIEGFDEMMNEIRRIVEFDVQKMIGSIQERQTQMIKQFKKFEPQYSAEILGEIAEALKEPAPKKVDNNEIQALSFFSQAYKAQTQGDLVKAEELYRKVIQLYPDYAVAYNNLGVLLYEDVARHDEAEAAYRKTIELKPDYADAYYNLGTLLSKDATRHDEAEAAYRKAIELKPDYADAYYNLGTLLYKNVARHAEAETAYRKAIELNPNIDDAYISLGTLLSKDVAHHAEAEAAYRKAIELKPDYANAYYNLGALLYEDVTRHAEAEIAYRKAIELKPDYANAYYNLGILLSKDAARYAEAEAAYRKAIELKPDFDSAYNNLGNLLYENVVRQAEAEAAYRKAIELKPDYADAYNNLGLLLSKDAARQAEAEAVYRKAIELKPNLYDAYSNLGLLLSKDAARQAEAEAVYRKAIELKPDSARVYYALITILRLQSRETEALPLAELALSLEPQNVTIFVALAALHKSLGQKSESDKYAAQARELMKADDWYNLACLESICGNTDAAIENLRHAAQGDSFDRHWARRDPDFEWIRDDPRFKEIVGEDGA